MVAAIAGVLIPITTGFGWLVVLNLTALGDSISVYIGPSPKEGKKRGEKCPI